MGLGTVCIFIGWVRRSADSNQIADMQIIMNKSRVGHVHALVWKIGDGDSLVKQMIEPLLIRRVSSILFRSLFVYTEQFEGCLLALTSFGFRPRNAARCLGSNLYLKPGLYMWIVLLAPSEKWDHAALQRSGVGMLCLIGVGKHG